MPISKKLNKIITIILFVIILIFFSTLHAKNFDKFNKAESIADYFSGVILLNQSKYDDSAKYLKRHNNILTIGIAFSFQKHHKIPVLNNDVKLNYILTEKGIN